MNNLRQNIVLKTTVQQNIVITQEMKQSLAMLQMPLQELTTEINIIIENNPLLEVIEKEILFDDDNDNDSDSDSDNDVDNIEQQNNINDIAETITSSDWQEYIGYDIKDDISYMPSIDDDLLNYEQFVSAKPSLYEHLLLQLKSLGIKGDAFIIGEFIIGNLSDEGYFLLDKEVIISELDIDIDIEHFEEILSIIKSFDPIGVAAESLNESILIQITALGVDSVYIELTDELLRNYTDFLMSYKYDKILKAMSIERDTFDYILSLIKKTDPKPGLHYSSSGINFVTPDVYIVRNGDKFDIMLNEHGLPAFKLNRYYLHMLKKSAIDKEAKQYIRDKVRNAVWVIESLQKRKNAIERVVMALIDIQKDFLTDGINYIKPLKLKDISEITGLHESTVSRVTSGKYAMTEHGMIELKSFFVKSIDTDDGDISTTKVKSNLKDIIDKETVDNPLSDQRLVELLGELGINIARRTVAKYRDELNIKTMSQRKRLRK